MTEVRVTVVVPTIGREDALARCLDAIIGGTVLPAEIVVVDQSGSDAISELHLDRSEAYPNVRRVVEERRGLSAARNAGARAATGNILAFTDDDCVPDPGWLEAVSQTLEREPSLAGVTGPMLPIGPEQPGLVAVSSRTSLVRVDHRRDSPPWAVGTGGNTTVRREWLERVGGWDERLGVGSRGKAAEDVALVDRMLRAGGVLRYEPIAVVRHERRPRSSQRATRWTYGHGVGAVCAMLLRSRDAHGISLLARWLALRLHLGIRAGRRGHLTTIGDELRVLGGTVAGLVHGIRTGGTG